MRVGVRKSAFMFMNGIVVVTLVRGTYVRKVILMTQPLSLVALVMRDIHILRSSETLNRPFVLSHLYFLYRVLPTFSYFFFIFCYPLHVLFFLFSISFLLEAFQLKFIIFVRSLAKELYFR